MPLICLTSQPIQWLKYFFNQNLTHIELDIKKPTLLHGFVEGVKTFQDKLNLGHVFKYQNNRLSTWTFWIVFSFFFAFFFCQELFRIKRFKIVFLTVAKFSPCKKCRQIKTKTNLVYTSLITGIGYLNL